VAVSEEEARYVGAQVAAALLENAASTGHDRALQEAVRRWFPDADRVDAIELRRITAQVRLELLLTRASIMNRNDLRVAEGKAKAV